VKEELTAVQRLAARLIVAKTPYAKIARQLKISISVLTRWRKEARFTQLVAELAPVEHDTDEVEEDAANVQQDDVLLPLAMRSLR
jgi:hypothetical protein